MMKRASSIESTPPDMTNASPLLPKSTQDLRKSYGTNWTKANVSVLFEWLSIASYNIRCLEMATVHYRKKLRMNTVTGLILATLSGTINTAQTAYLNGTSSEIVIALNIVLIIMAFSIAIMTGYIKVYQIQENLENSIKIKQEWIVFSTEIASELQLPTELRRDALWIIIKNKTVYLELLKMNLEIPDSIIKQARKDFKEETKLNMDVSSLPRILIDIGIQEMRDLDINNKEERITSTAQKHLKHLATFQPKKTVSMLKPIKEEEDDEKVNTLDLNDINKEINKEIRNVLRDPLSSVRSERQVVSINMNDSPTHPHLELPPV